MKTFNQFLDEALKSSVVQAAARQKYTSTAALKRVGDDGGSAPQNLKFKKLYHGTTKPSSQEISKSGWKTDVNVSQQKRGAGVYATPEKKTAIGYAAGKVRQQGQTPEWNNIGIRRFNMPKNVYDDAMRRQAQNPNDWANISQVKQVTMKPSYANKIDITDKSKSAVDLNNTQKTELRQRVNTALRKPQNRAQLSKQIKGQSASSRGAGSASGTTGRGQYQVGGGEGYGLLGIKLAN